MNKTNILRTTGRAAMALAFWVVQAAVAGTPSITTGGDAGWTEESAGCWRSGAIEDSQFSWIEFTVDDAPCGVSFQWKASSEKRFDELFCYLDDTEAVPAISGEMGAWEHGSLLVAESGSHAIRFEYSKDYSGSKGDDCGWVKDFATSAVSVRTLALDANGGDADMEKTTVADGYAVGALPDAVWNGEGCFRFLGWFTEETGGKQVTPFSICQAEWTTLFARWSEMHPPANDNFADAVTISGATGSVEGTTIDSAREAADLIPDEYYSGYCFTVWYKWSPPEDGTYVFTVANAEGRTAAVGVTTGYEGAEGAWSDATVNWRRTRVQAIKGVTYWIEVGSCSSEELDFTLSWRECNPPENDNFADAATISGATGSVEGTTIDSTREVADLIPDEYYSDYRCTVWYQWTAPEDGIYAFAVADADEELEGGAAVGVTTGYDEEAGDWTDAAVNWQQTTLQATKGAVYWIEVGSYFGQEFDFTLSWTKLNPPANDNFADAETISGATGSVEGTTIDSTREAADLISDRYNYSYSRTVWYQWTAPEDGPYAFTVADADGERRWGAAVGVTTGYDEEEGAWSDADVNWKRITVQSTKGVTYWIEVGSDNEFDFTLSWKKLTPPANDNFADAATVSGTTGIVEGTTIDSTTEKNDLLPDWWGIFGGGSVWYQWTAPEDGLYRFTVAAADGEQGGSADVGVTTGYDEEKGDWSDADVNWRRTTVQAIKGVTYWIEVGSYFGQEFDFTLSWTKFNPPANDNFADAETISGAAGSIEGTTIDSTREAADLIPDRDGSSHGSTVWYQWTAPEDGVYSFTVADADGEGWRSAPVGVTTGFDKEEGDWSDADVNWRRTTVQAIKGVTYWIEVGSSSDDEFDFTLSWVKLNPPANDNFAGAATISGATGSVEGTTFDSTRESVDLLPDSYNCTVWYQWTAPEDGFYAFTVADADGAGWNAAVGVTTGYDEEEKDWSGAVVNWQMTTIQAVKGVTYWIEVGGESGAEFDFTLSWKSFNPPANDNFADAIEIEGISGSTSGSNLGAGVEEGEPLPLEEEGGWPFGTTASVWWKWKAPEGGMFTVSTEGSDFDTVLGVYTGTSADSLATVAANDQAGTNSTSLATFSATAGTVYYFAVGGYKSYMGDIVLGWKRVDGTGDAVIDVGGGKTVTVPGAWLEANTTRAATDMAANGRLLVWQCYVLGLDPEGTDDFRIVSFPMNADRTPDWEHIGVHPDPATWNVPAMLQLKGAATLDGPWIVVPGVGGEACRFFAAGFVLP